MEWLSKIIVFLQGKKTYVIAFVTAIFNFGITVGWWTPDNQLWVAINLILGALGLGALRAGISK